MAGVSVDYSTASAASAATAVGWFRRLTRFRGGEPRLTRIDTPTAGDFVLTRERVAEMWRIIRLAEGSAHRATSTDRHIARVIHGAIDQAEHIVTAGSDRDPDQLVAWLARFDEAVLRLARVERLR